MYLISRISALIVLVLLSTAWAGEKGGNGGDAVVCRDTSGKIISADPLDSYEAYELRGISISNLPSNLDQKEAYEILLERLERFSPKRAERFRLFFDVFQKEQILVEGELVDISDSRHLTFKQGCKVEQLIIQQIPQTPFDKKFIIQREIWGHLNVGQKAIMIMHEALLNEAMTAYEKLKWKEIDTIGIRYVNSLLFGFESDDSTVSEKMFIDGLLLIPNIYLAESKFFGEFVLKFQLKGIYLNIVQGYDNSEDISELIIIEDPTTGQNDSKIGTIKFHSEFNKYGDKFQFHKHHVQKVSDEFIKVRSVKLNWSQDGFTVSDSTIGAKIVVPSGLGIEFTDSYECGFHDEKCYFTQTTLTINIINSIVTNLDSKEVMYHDSAMRFIGVPVGPVNFISRLCEAATPIEINYNPKTQMLSYRNSLCSERVLKFKNGVLVPLQSDSQLHEIRLNSEGMPIEDYLNIVWARNYVDNFITLPGQWLPNNQEAEQFLPFSYGRGDFKIHFRAQPLPKNSNIQLATSEDYNIAINKNSRSRCMRVLQGSSWPIQLSPGWVLSNKFCE